jgi:hypothetical protein
MDAPPPPPVDSGKCTIVGCPCTRNGDCDSDICADSTILTSVETGRVCTKPCCASSDCASGFVCFAAGTGGNYCVAASLIGRTTLGGVPGGGACANDETCRSGKCGQGGKCLDACCKDANCPGGQCAQDTQQTGHDVLQCTGNAGTKTNGQTCSSASSCDGAVCEYENATDFNMSCMAPCCASSPCGSGYACFDLNINGPSGTDWIPVCSQPQGNDTDGQPLAIGPGAMGATCALNRDCRSVHCLAGKCTDVCCTDADCTAIAGWVCQPRPTGGTNGVFLRCGPPL